MNDKQTDTNWQTTYAWNEFFAGETEDRIDYAAESEALAQEVFEGIYYSDDVFGDSDDPHADWECIDWDDISRWCRNETVERRGDAAEAARMEANR